MLEAYFHLNATPLPGNWGASTYLVCLEEKGKEKVVAAGQTHKLFKQMCIAGGNETFVRTWRAEKKQQFVKSAFLSDARTHEARIHSEFTAQTRVLVSQGHLVDWQIVLLKLLSCNL